MEITIIGWYGTETIGDRAILAGLLHIFYKSFGHFTIHLGSLYPFYTQRTIIEDSEFYRYCASDSNLLIDVFDSRNPFELNKNIKASDFLAVGGGPLMDLLEMNMLDYAFRYAHKQHVKTVLLGCGWGPLRNKKYIDVALRLIHNSNLTIFRDHNSIEQFKKYSDYNGNVYAVIDPAFIACKCFKDKHKNEVPTREFNCANFRDVAIEGDHYANKKIQDGIFANYISALLAQSYKPVKLIPMHNFYIGGDDRIILNRIKSMVNNNRVQVVYVPQSLEETMSLYYNSDTAIGMRFHSVVLQTILNGRNIILDYTDPVTGKIISLLKQLDLKEIYGNRYISLYSDKILCTNTENINTISIDNSILEHYEQQYVNLLKSIFRNKAIGID